MAIIKVAMAYTSVSTALNQNESVNENAKLPTKPLPRIAIAFCWLRSFLLMTSFFNNRVMVQNIKRMVNALATALIMFIMKPIWSGLKANMAKNAPNI